MAVTKRCTKCGEAKPLDAFYPRPDRPGGLGVRNPCRACMAGPARERARRNYAAKADVINANQRAKRAANPEPLRQYERDLRARRTDQQRATASQRNREWREGHKEEWRAYQREWAKANPKKRGNLSPEAKARHATYLRERKKVQHEWLKAYREEHGCVDCGKKTGRLEFDHRPDEAKSFNVTQGLGYSWEVLRAEVAKCDVRCSRCHRQRHAAARGLKTH